MAKKHICTHRNVEQVLTNTQTNLYDSALRMVPCFVTVLIYSAYFEMVKETWVSYGWCLLIPTGIFSHIIFLWLYGKSTSRAIGIQKGNW